MLSHLLSGYNGTILWLSGDKPALSGDKVCLSGDKLFLSGDKVCLSGDKLILLTGNTLIAGIKPNHINSVP